MAPCTEGRSLENHSKSGFTKTLCFFEGVTLAMRFPENLWMGDCKVAPWTWSPVEPLVHQEQQHLGGERLLPHTPVSPGASPPEPAWPVRHFMR